MTYLEVVRLLEKAAKQQVGVNTVVREFTDLNREDTVYSAVVIQDRDGIRGTVNHQDYITYMFYIGYVDRLTEESVNLNPIPSAAYKYISNRDDIISTGINVIKNIVNSVNSSGIYPQVEITTVDRINTFNQRFTANCAGVYMVIAVNVLESDCVDVDVNVYNRLEKTITSNGVYNYLPEGLDWDGVTITVDVSESKPEEVLQETIYNNGSYEFTPSAGSVFSEVDIDVDVHPSVSLSETYTSNGSYSISGEFSGGEVTVAVHPSVSLSETYTSNGSYSISGEFDGGVVTVAVPSDAKPEQVGNFEVTDWNTAVIFTPDPGYVFSAVEVLNNTPVKSYVSTVTSNSRLIWNASDGEALVNHIDISIAVPSDRKPEESLAETISSNGSYSFSPSSGSVFSDASIVVDVHPSNSLSRTYTTNGTKTITGEFNGGTINISVHPSTSLSETYTSNGSYNISGEFDGGVVTVAVPSTVTVTMTQAQYDALAVKDPNTIYLING